MVSGDRQKTASCVVKCTDLDVQMPCYLKDLGPKVWFSEEEEEEEEEVGRRRLGGVGGEEQGEDREDLPRPQAVPMGWWNV